MSSPDLNPELAAMESLFQSLTPAEASIPRDQLLYAAGARGAARRAKRGQRVWQTSTAALLCASLTLLAMLFSQGGQSAAGIRQANQQPPTPAEDALRPQQDVPREATDAQGPDSPQVEMAFSSIFNVNSWSRERLNAAGIVVKPWSHPWQGEDPPLQWVEIAFDPSNAGAYAEVVMTGRLIGQDFNAPNACRAQHLAGSEGTPRLILAIDEASRANSRVEIFIWRPTPDGGAKASGYTLGARRLLELAAMQ